MKNFTIKLFLLFLVLGTVASPTHAQNKPMHEVHSMMIYNFIKYIQWPGHNPEDDFVIGIIGDDEVYQTLNSWYGGQVRGDKKFVVKKIDNASVYGCHILYVAKNSSNDFDGIKAKLLSSSTLIITDKPGLGQQGSSINFTTRNDKLVFELNQKAVENSRLKVSSQLSNIAILI